MKAHQRLGEEFLAPYYKKGDNFPNLLARSTYLSKYSRDGESWTDTIRRTVDGNCDLAKGTTMEERELLFHVFWTMQALPPGRGLWVGGVEGIPADARYNCWYTTVYDYKDWGWIANQLMLGGGVGVGLSDVSALPTVARDDQAVFQILCDLSHPNHSDVKPDHPGFDSYIPRFEYVQDSREGWVSALVDTLGAAFSGKSIFRDVTPVRARGMPIKTFGGTACGPGPLVELLRSVWTTVRGAQGRRLTSVEALDITNFVGKCIKAGNVRRSALIALGQPSDQDFRDAKKNWDAVLSHRHTSNNSIAFTDFDQFDGFDWKGLAMDNIEFGEPGILNLALGRRTDPGAMGVNPCGEQLLHDREACNLAEVFPANFDGSVAPHAIFKLVARYCLRQRLTPLLDDRSNEVGQKNMRVGVGLGGICDFEWTEALLASWFNVVREACNNYADELGVAHPITTTTVKPSGTISLLCGSSPGLHSPFDEYYMRRTRHAVNDPMTAALVKAGVPFETDQYDNTGRTLVFTFPMKAKHTRTTVQTETLRDQFERQLAVQNSWADNAVSCTITFDKDRPDELAASMREFVPRLKSTSCLPKAHGYAQAPYESIDAHRFAELSRGIDFSARLERGADFDVEECAGGVCPVK
jgi:ribonucleoside-triphosphate reductase